MKKLSLIIAILLVFGLAASCNGDNSGLTVTTTANSNSDNASATLSTTQPRPDLPSKDFKEHEFKVRHDMRIPELIPNYISVESENGEVWNDSIYKRNTEIESKYNVKIISNLLPLNAATARSSIMSGILDHDIYIGQLTSMGTLVMEGLMVDQKQLEYFNLDMPWWDTHINDGFSLANKLFMSSGALITQNSTSTYLMRFNIDLGNKFNIDKQQLYDLVKSGKWTIDEMMNISKVFYSEINGDGVNTWDDRYPLAAVDSMAQAMFYAVGLSVTGKDAQGMITYNAFDDVTNNALNKVLKLFTEPNYMINGNKTQQPGLNHSQTTETSIAENRSFLHATMLEAMIRGRDVETAIGILPMPKVDEKQKNYISILNPNGCALALGIPVSSNEEDLERTSIIVEALMAESHYSVKDKFYNTVLQHKLLRDQESYDMLDYIMEMRQAPDLGFIYQYGGLLAGIQSEIVGGTGNFASKYESLKDATEKAIADHNEKLK